MIHIKTPVRVTLYGNIADSANELAFEARGPNFANLSKEAVPAINAYDDLVDQRADLIAQRDALAKAADGLYDTVQDLRRVINGALRDDESGPVLDDVMSRGRKHIKAYHAALAAAKGDQ